MTFDDWPGLRRAALAIAYDNGMINRDQTEEQFLRETATTLGQNISGDRFVVEAFFDLLTQDELDLVCAGAEHEVEAFLAERNAPPAVPAYLCAIFEGTWDMGPASDVVPGDHS